MARSADGTNTNYLERTSALVTAYPFTMACWFRPANVTTTYGLMRIGVSGSGDNSWDLLARGATAGDPVSFLVRTTSGQFADTTTGYTANVWQTAIAVGISATSRNVYLNNGSVGSNVSGLTPSGMNNTRLFFAEYATNVLGFNGRIAEAAIWNIALSADARAAYNAGVNPMNIEPLSLVAYWPVHGVFSPEPDVRGANSLTLVGTVNQADHAPVTWKNRLITAPDEVAAAGGSATARAMGTYRRRRVA